MNSQEKKIKTPQPLRITLVWINYYRSLYNSPKKSFLSDLFPLLGHNGLHFAFFVLDAFPTLFKLQSNAIQLGGHGIWKMEEKKIVNWLNQYLWTLSFDEKNQSLYSISGVRAIYFLK